MKFLIRFFFLILPFTGFSQDKPGDPEKKWKAGEMKEQYRCACSEIGLDPVWADTNRVSCYTIPVERNHSKPRKENYLLAVAVADALSGTPKEPLLYLHGGPGIATLGNLPRYLKNKTFSLLRRDHDLVFFDYRGTGFSAPALCKSLDDSLRNLSHALTLEERIEKETALYANCKASLLGQGIDPSAFSSLQSAADATGVMKALGRSEYVIYSVSHGTTVALNMMRSFPEPINSVILDSPFPPNAPWLDFVHPFDTCFRFLEKKISEEPTYAALFPAIRNDFIKIADRLQRSPFIISSGKDKDSINRTATFSNTEFAWSVWSAMLDPYYIRLVPLALKEIASGNDSVLVRWAMLFNNPNSFGEFASAQSRAILGYETKPRFREETETYLQAHFPEFKHFITPGLDSAINAVYRPEIPPKEYFDAVISDIPTLIIAGEYDPVCPPLIAEITAKTLSNSTLVVVPAASHAALYADECTRNIGATFYLNPGKQPDLDCLESRKPVEFVTKNLLKTLE